MAENILCLFGSQSKSTVDVFPEGTISLFGSSSPPRSGFFQVKKLSSGEYELIKFVKVSTDDYYKLKALGVFDRPTPPQAGEIIAEFIKNSEPEETDIQEQSEDISDKTESEDLQSDEAKTVDPNDEELQSENL